MPPVHRLGDANTAGGAITTIPQSTVFADGRLVAVDGSAGSGHPPCPDPPVHCAGAWVTANGSATVRIGGRPVNRQGDRDSCGHARAAGSATVRVGG